MASSYYHALGSGQMYYWVGVPDYRKYFEKLSNKKCCEKKESGKFYLPSAFMFLFLPVKFSSYLAT